MSARAIFGRNAIVRQLGVKSAAMVSKSPVWQTIAAELGLGNRSRTPNVKVGLAIAEENRAVANGDTTLDAVVRNETIRLAKKWMPKNSVATLIDELEKGNRTDDETREIINLTRLQKQDNNRFAPSKP
jgi:hypothetical protein